MNNYIYELEVDKIGLRSIIKKQSNQIDSYKHVYCKCAKGESIESHYKIGIKLCPK